MYGLATDNSLVRDLGRILLATEIRGAQKYWQIKSEDNIYPAPFEDNKVVGILWSTKVLCVESKKEKLSARVIITVRLFCILLGGLCDLVWW